MPPERASHIQLMSVLASALLATQSNAIRKNAKLRLFIQPSSVKRPHINPPQRQRRG
jgi:hypothetical protein